MRGTGLWRALVLTAAQAPALEAAARQAGFLVNAVKPDAIRLAPPLILTAAEMDELAARFPQLPWTRSSERARHFLRDDDLSPDEQIDVLDLAAA